MPSGRIHQHHKLTRKPRIPLGTVVRLEVDGVQETGVVRQHKKSAMPSQWREATTYKVELLDGRIVYSTGVSPVLTEGSNGQHPT